MPDLSYYPESHLVKQAMENPVAFGQKNRAEIGELADIADLMLRPFSEVQAEVEAALKSDQAMQRYWGAKVCTRLGSSARAVVEDVRSLLNGPDGSVKQRALEFLGSIGEMNPQPELTALVNETDNPAFAVEALNSVIWFKDHFAGKYPVMRSDLHPICRGGDIDDRLNYINGTPYPPEGKGKKKKAKKK